jgi:hypothetical protein
VTRRIPPVVGEPQTPAILRLFQAIVVAVLAYFTAAFLFFMLQAMSRIPTGPYWDSNLQEPLLFVLLIVTVGLCLVPYFQRDWNPYVRMFSIILAVFLIAYAVFRDSGVIDLDYPLRLINRNVFNPFRKAIGF